MVPPAEPAHIQFLFILGMAGGGSRGGVGGCYHEALQIGHHCFHKAFLYQISTGMIAGTGAGGQMLRLWILWDDCGFCNTRAKERTGPLESEVLKEKVDVKVVNL